MKNRILFASLCLMPLAAAAGTAGGLAPLVPGEQEVHRGWGVDWPENAMVSIRRCWQAGLAPEIDARRSADGVYYALHDLNGRYDLTNISWQTIGALDVGARKGRQWAGERPAQWKDVLAEMAGHPERRVYLDLKDATPEQMAALAAGYGVERQMICLASGDSTVRRWKKAVPGGRTCWVAHPGTWKRAFLTGEDAAKVETTVQRNLDRMAAAGFDGADVVQFVVRVDPSRPEPFCPGRDFLKKSIARVHAAGRKVSVMVWTGGDNVESYRLLRGLGVDSFGTDYPETLLRFLGEAGRCGN